jgi:hypothetical protein
MDALFVAVVRFAAPLHAVVTRRELRSLGVADRLIDRWVADGLLHRVFQGVYAVGRPDLTPDGHRLAAVRALGSTAVLSHGSAAALWEITNTALFPVHITVPGSGRRPRQGIRLHPAPPCTPTTPPPCTTSRSPPSPATCLDHAAQSHVTVARLIQVVEQAQRERRFDLAAFATTLRRNPHHPGAPKLQAVLPKLDDEPPDIASLLEGAFYEFCDERDITRPLSNVDVAGHKVDAHWPDCKLVVELTSKQYHLTPKAFEVDPVRDADLQRAGQRVLQVTWKRLTQTPDELYDDIMALAAYGAPATSVNTTMNAPKPRQ